MTKQFYNSSAILRSLVTSSALLDDSSSYGMNVTESVSDSTVSRLVRLCGEIADGSGDVSVILEPYAGLLCVT